MTFRDGVERNKEVILFGTNSFSDDGIETHEAGHAFGLGHSTTNGMGELVPKQSFYNMIGLGGSYHIGKQKYNSDGLLKHGGGSGSSNLKQTQAKNLLNSTSGKK